jgi:hypothetical protein
MARMARYYFDLDRAKAEIEAWLVILSAGKWQRTNRENYAVGSQSEVVGCEPNKNEKRDRGAQNNQRISNTLAETERFELSIRCNPYNGLANRRLQPLGHVSAERNCL